MRPIGGFFELELRSGPQFYADALALNTARNALGIVLAARKYQKIFLPEYSCEVLLEPIRALGLDYELYPIDDALDPVFDREPGADEAFLYINYFGLKNPTVARLAERFGTNLIIDNAQAFFARPLERVDTFYSPRKFFGVPDGAYLFTDAHLPAQLDEDASAIRMKHLLGRVESGPEAAYGDFSAAEASLTNQPVRRMSKLTSMLLGSIDYASASAARSRNYAYLDEQLGDRNMLPTFVSDGGPMVYPFRTQSRTLRDRLIKNKIFVATYWPNVGTETGGESLATWLAEQIIPLPVDQRYDVDDLSTIVRVVNED